MGKVLKPKKSPPPINYEALAAARAEEERKKELERQRRGVEGTIKTSYTGVLNKSSDGTKKLLGE